MHRRRCITTGPLIRVEYRDKILRVVVNGPEALTSGKWYVISEFSTTPGAEAWANIQVVV